MTTKLTNTASHPARRLSPIVQAAVAIAMSFGLTGCFGFLKPAKATARHFVLSTVPAAGAPAANSSLAIGVGPVKISAYLFNTALAVRKGPNEIEYLPASFWAERLDTGLQRTVAVNLATLLPTDKIRFSAWQTGDVTAEVFVTVDQLDVDVQGQVSLNAWWRILSPGGEKVLKSGEFRGQRQGAAPDKDPAGAVAAQSELVGELSRQIAQAVKDTVAK